MTKQILTLDYIPCDLNRYINAQRSNRYLGAKIKKEETERAYWLAKNQLTPITKPIKIVNFHWVVKNRKKDPDNIAWGKKAILDSLVMAKIIKNDGMAEIGAFSDTFEVGREEKVIIELNY